MGSSAQTSTINLPLFSDDDRPTWRGDINGAMNSIDAAINADRGNINDIAIGFDQTTATNIGTDGSKTSAAGDGRWVRSAALGISQVVNPTHTALQAALSTLDGLRVTTSGAYSTDQTLTITRECDLSMLKITYTGTSDAVVVGAASTQTFRQNIKLPFVINVSKNGAGWSQSGVIGTNGIRLVNLYSCTITVPYINNFERGLVVSGAANNGSQQNTINLGHLDNNKINLDFNSPDNAGWCNQNSFIGGRLSHNSNEGSQVAGTRHVRFSALANAVNGNTFTGISLESPDVVEYHIETANAVYNTMVNARFENTVSAHRRILSSGTSKNNVLLGGAYAELITQTCTGGAQPWAVRTSGINQMFQSGTGPAAWIENSTGNSASAFCVTPAGIATTGADPVASSALNITANGLYGKRGTDAVGNERVVLDFQNGLTKYGPGGAAPSVTVGQLGGFLSFGGVTTQTTAPAPGAGAALPATPAGYLTVFVNGNNQKIPYY